MIRALVFHSIVCCVAILLSSCNPIQQKDKTVSQKPVTLGEKISDVDSSFLRLGRTISFLDSNLKYGRLAKEMEIKMVQAEADYYKTTDEKYYKLYYKYQKKQWTYVGLANRYDDSLKSSVANQK